MADEITPPANADKGSDNPPAGSDAGQGSNAEAPISQLPEKFKGKSGEEIAKAYLELESKMGEQSKTVEEASRLKDQTDTLLRAIWSDPDLYRQVEAGVKKYASGESLPSRDIPKGSDKAGGEGAKDEKNDHAPQIKDLRMAEENRVLDDFFTKYGYKGLTEKDRKESYQRLVVSLAETYDPGGKKPIQQILSEIPLAKLPRYLENAHFLGNKDQIIDRAKRSALISTEENNAASIGSFSSGSPDRSSTVTLTQKEREIAGKLGISEDKYLKRKIETAKDASRYNS
ncbi:MAG: hypothetical protein WC810_14340 [Janthinobacterium sp.]|jgi:hypothetical protein